MAKKILAVDDSASMRQMVSLTLKSVGYTVVESVDGVDGLRKAQEDTFNLILTDQNMPHMDGLSLVKSLRALPQYARTPILILTTESSAEIKAQGKAAGANGWLTKPFDPVKMLELIKTMID
jgi:two-component system chemotaxis response regulator CheY